METGVILREDAFIPFSTNPVKFLGKQLATMELRYILATLFRRSDPCLDDGKMIPLEKSLKGRYVMSKGTFLVKFTLGGG